MNNTLYILDGHGLIFRSYFAHQRNPLSNSRGENTSAIYGFFQTIRKIYQNYKPMYFIVALDSKGKTFRNDMYTEYKANRQSPPEDLLSQISIITDILLSLEIPHLAVPGMEADDIIASLVTQSSKQDIKSTIITSDKDLFQLLDTKVDILRPTSKSSEWEKVDNQWLKENWQLTPSQVRDYLAITGDKSDNVPGVLGIGEKGAVTLLSEYESLSNIYEHVDSIKDSMRKKLIQSKDKALLSYELVSLKYDIPVPDIHSLKHTDIAWQKAHHIFSEQDIFTFSKNTPAQNTNNNDVSQNNSGDEPDYQASDSATSNSDPIPAKPTYNCAKNIVHKYSLLRNSTELDALIKQIKQTKLMCLDTETDSLDPLTAVPVGISISTKPHEAWYIPIKYPEATPANSISIQEDQVRDALRPLFDGSIHIVMHNAKFDLAILENWGIACTALQQKAGTVLFDTLLAAWMCMPNIYSYSMDDLSRQLLNYDPIAYSQLSDDNNAPASCFSLVPLAQACEYAAEDADITLQLYLYFDSKLKELSEDTLFRNLEMPLLLLLYRIEKIGLELNVEYMQQLSAELAVAIAEKTQLIYSLCGEEFNINSTKQLQEILFTKLGLKPLKKNKTGYSTDIAVMEQLSFSHPVPQEILNYRHLSKLKSTYTDTLPQQIHPISKKIHTNLQQTGTETGRISSINPNLQNIPVKDDWGKRIRTAFVPAKGHQYISADYSQIELMVLAHLSEDKNMLEAFRNNIDIHCRTASILFTVDEDKVSSDQRRIAKTINFGVIYGMSAFRLSNALKIPQKEAKAFIEAYFSEFAGVTAFIASTIESTLLNGYTNTLLGHKRPITNISSKNANLRKAAERIAVNTTIQGSAADIVKLAMLEVNAQLLKQNFACKLILQIHDELLFECPDKEVATVLPIIKHSMEQAYTLAIPLKVSISSGNNWGDLK